MHCDHFVSSENLLNQNVLVFQKSVIDLVEVKCRVKISKLTKPILHQMKTCQNATMCKNSWRQSIWRFFLPLHNSPVPYPNPTHLSVTCKCHGHFEEDQLICSEQTWTIILQMGLFRIKTSRTSYNWLPGHNSTDRSGIFQYKCWIKSRPTLDFTEKSLHQ